MTETVIQIQAMQVIRLGALFALGFICCTAFIVSACCALLLGLRAASARIKRRK